MRAQITSFGKKALKILGASGIVMAVYVGLLGALLAIAVLCLIEKVFE